MSTGRAGVQMQWDNSTVNNSLGAQHAVCSIRGQTRWREYLAALQMTGVDGWRRLYAEAQACLLGDTHVLYCYFQLLGCKPDKIIKIKPHVRNIQYVSVSLSSLQRAVKSAQSVI